MQDQQTGMSFYTANVEINDEEMKKLKDNKLYPGMPADVLIVTGSRSLMNYFISPIKSSMNKSFREE